MNPLSVFLSRMYVFPARDFSVHHLRHIIAAFADSVPARLYHDLRTRIRHPELFKLIFEVGSERGDIERLIALRVLNADHEPIFTYSRPPQILCVTASANIFL